MKSVYSAVRTGYLNKAVCASSLKGLKQLRQHSVGQKCSKVAVIMHTVVPTDSSLLGVVHNLTSHFNILSSVIKSNNMETRSFTASLSPEIRITVTNLMAGGRVFVSRKKS
jgi:hypothetical protein